MALTITEKFREYCGAGKRLGFLVTHDGSTVSITAGSLDLDYVTWVEQNTIAYVSAFIPDSAFASLMTSLGKLSIAADGTAIAWAASPESGTTTRITVLGW